MTNTTNATASAHATCTHPRTKVDRARCRKARAASTSRVVDNKINIVIANGSKVVHRVANDVYACTKRAIKIDAILGRDLPSAVTCKNCLKHAAA